MHLTRPNRYILFDFLVQVTVYIFNIQYEYVVRNLPVSRDSAHTRDPCFNSKLIIRKKQIFTAMLNRQDAAHS